MCSFSGLSDVPSTYITESKPEKYNENQLEEKLPITHESKLKTETYEFKEIHSQAAFVKPMHTEVPCRRETTVTTELSAKTPMIHTQSENTYHEDPCKLKSSNVQPEIICENNKPPEVQVPSSVNENTVKKYSYAGPPKISLSTWNERPKRQVSIKTDRDYVIGIRQRLQQRSEAVEAKPMDNNNIVDNKPVSRVPIVKSVELKKPFAEQLQTTSPVLALSEAIRAQAKLSNGYCYRNTVSTNAIVVTNDRDHVIKTKSSSTEKNGSSHTFAKMTTRPRKLREISTNVDPRECLLESIRLFGGRDNLKKIRA